MTVLHNYNNTLSRETRTRARTRENRETNRSSRGGDRGQLDPSDIGRIAVTVLIAGVLVFIAAPIFVNSSTVAATELFNASAQSEYQDSRLGEAPNNVSVSPSTGQAAYLFDDSDIVADAGATLTAGNWTVAATSALDTARVGATSVPHVVASYDNGSVVIYYNNSSYHGYYDNGSANATVSIAEPDPANFTSTVLRWNGSELLLSNGTANASASLSTTQNETPLLFDWQGRLDELRTYNNSVNDSTVTGYTADPVSAYPNETQGVRLMFDRRQGDTVAQYFTAGDASVDHVFLTGGIAPPDMSEGADYEINSDPFEVSVVSGGYLEGQPAVIVSYGDSGAAASLLVPIVIVAMLLTVLAVPALKVKEAVDI